MKRRPTIRDIAAKAGYHFTTVSLALRNHPSIPEKTREKIKVAADELGYKPDPVLSALMAYRKTVNPQQVSATLAWAVVGQTRKEWRQDVRRVECFEGARKQADKLGYKLDEIWLDEPGLDGERRAEILYTRSINGAVLVAPDTAAVEVDIRLDELSMVALGECGAPAVHCVATDAFRSMQTLAFEIVRRGYIRAGLVSRHRRTPTVHDAWEAGLWLGLLHAPDREMAPTLDLPEWDADIFGTWFTEHLPCVVVTPFTEAIDWLRANGYDVPGDVAVVSPSLPMAETGMSGMQENTAELGAAAIDYVVGLMHRHERGVPALPKRLMVGSTWFEGSTIAEKNSRVMMARKRAADTSARQVSIASPGS